MWEALIWKRAAMDKKTIEGYQLGIESSCVSGPSDHRVTTVVDQTTGV